VAGVSFAPSDFELQWLLRAAGNARLMYPHTVCIVNPNDEARDRARRALYHSEATFENYKSIEDLVSGKTL
jgi:hypothetical protein